MAQTSEGAAKARAQKVGLSLEALLTKEAAEKWCWSCPGWSPRAAFNADRSRYDGLSSRCRTCTRVKIRVSTKGRPSIFKGRTHTVEARAVMSAQRLGRPGPRKGQKLSLEERARISAATRASPNLLRGAQCHGYIDGKALERVGMRATAEVKQWRYDVFVRDRFTCQDCGDDRGGNLHAHHIKPFATYPDLRLEVSNGVTLCRDCHKARHSSGNL